MSIRIICELFGKSRQSWYERSDTFFRRSVEESFVLSWVRELRKDLPRLGVHKLHHLLKPRIASHGIRMGRDRLWKLLQSQNLLVPRKRKRGYKTTYSFHRFWKWDCLLEGFEPNRAGELWVADITYIRLAEGYCYLSLITDGYSRKIVGYYLSSDLRVQGPLQALIMALENRVSTGRKLIHHSDRGFQYCSHEYVETLLNAGIRISMTQSGDPTENPLAERVNGILKSELGLKESFDHLEDADLAVGSAIYRYNYRRPHGSIDYLTPAQAHQKTGMLRKRWYKQKRKPK